MGGFFAGFDRAVSEVPLVGSIGTVILRRKGKRTRNRRFGSHALGSVLNEQVVDLLDGFVGFLFPGLGDQKSSSGRRVTAGSPGISPHPG